MSEKIKVFNEFWISLIDPNLNDIKKVSKDENIPIEFLEDSLDLNESARVQYDDEYDCTLIINSLPVKDQIKNDLVSFKTIPIGLIITKEKIITICKRGNKVIDKLTKTNLLDKNKEEFLLDLLYFITIEYLNKLKIINRERTSIESNLLNTSSNRELKNLMQLEKSLVYFITSLKANDRAINKISRIKSLNLSDDQEYYLEEIKIENKQAIETTELYSKIIDSVSDSFSSLISNNLNSTMKTLTMITVFLTVPTIIFSFFGMNIKMPINTENDFLWLILLCSFLPLGFIIFIFTKFKK